MLHLWDKTKQVAEVRDYIRLVEKLHIVDSVNVRNNRTFIFRDTNMIMVKQEYDGKVQTMSISRWPILDSIPKKHEFRSNSALVTFESPKIGIVSDQYYNQMNEWENVKTPKSVFNAHGLVFEASSEVFQLNVLYTERHGVILLDFDFTDKGKETLITLQENQRIPDEVIVQ